MASENTTHDWSPGASGYIYDQSFYADGTPFVAGDTLIVAGGGFTGATGIVTAANPVGYLVAGTYVYSGTAAEGIDFTDIGIPTGASIIDTNNASGGLLWSVLTVNENDGAISIGTDQSAGTLLMVMSASQSNAVPEFINTGSFTVQNQSKATLQANNTAETFDNTASGVLAITGGSAFVMESLFTQIAGVPGVTLQNDGTIVVDAGSVLTDEGDLTGTGTVEVSGNANQTAFAAVAGNLSNNVDILSGELQIGNESNLTDFTGSVTFENANGILLNQSFASLQDGTIYGFRAGDKLEFTTTVFFPDPPTLSYDAADGLLIASLGAGADYDFHLAGQYQLSDFSVSGDGLSSYVIETTATAPCFAAGTSIATVRGPVPVETIRKGDELVLAHGGTAPVIWAGRRRVRCSRHPDPDSVRPVRIRAGAFGHGVPRRDLVVSPDHAIYVDGVLVPAGLLRNGTSVVGDDADEVRYHHLELDRHAVILAEGLPVETYLDTGNRDSFANAPLVEIRPEFGPGTVDREPCAPMVLDGERLAAVRATLDGHATLLAEDRHAA